VIHEHAAGGPLVLERKEDPPPCRASSPFGTPVSVGTGGSFRSPALLLVAGTAVYLGYCSTGVIATAGTSWGSLVAGRPMLLVEGACLLAAGLLLTQPAPCTRPVPPHRDSGRSAIAWTGIVVLLASVAAAVTGRRMASDALGVAELAFAAVSIGVVVATERHRQSDFRRHDRSGR